MRRPCLPFAEIPVNADVVSDLQVTFTSSPHVWRIIRFQTCRGFTVEFVTNDFDLQPGVVVFLCSRRREKEKCFGTWKTDFTQELTACRA